MMLLETTKVLVGASTARPYCNGIRNAYAYFDGRCTGIWITSPSGVRDQLTGGGPLAGIKVAAAAPSEGQLDSDEPRPGPAKDLDDNARQRIAALPGVKSVAAVVAVPVLVALLEKDWAAAQVANETRRRFLQTVMEALQRPALQVAPGLWACGDYVNGPYPATLEGAVRAGLAVAGKI